MKGMMCWRYSVRIQTTHRVCWTLDTTAEVLQQHHGPTDRLAFEMGRAAKLQQHQRRFLHHGQIRSAPFPYDGRAQGLHHLDHCVSDLRPNAVPGYERDRVRLAVAGQRHVRHQAPRARADELAHLRMLQTCRLQREAVECSKFSSTGGRCAW